jgi:hypothetical protein
MSAYFHNPVSILPRETTPSPNLTTLVTAINDPSILTLIFAMNNPSHHLWAKMIHAFSQNKLQIDGDIVYRRLSISE